MYVSVNLFLPISTILYKDGTTMPGYSKKNKKQSKASLIRKTVVDDAKLTRYAVKGKVVNKNRPVMTTDGLVAFVEKGVSSMIPGVGQQAISLFSETDNKLYQAKQRNRNCVVSD